MIYNTSRSPVLHSKLGFVSLPQMWCPRIPSSKTVRLRGYSSGGTRWGIGTRRVNAGNMIVN